MAEAALAPVPVSELERRLGIEVTSAAPGRVEGSMPVDGNRQPFGMLHGGASCVLAETLASVGACLHFAPGAAAGTELSATHLRPVTGGRVTGVATALRLGRTQATYSIDVTDERGRLVCVARLTCVATAGPSAGH
ncbi:PaaI family thioesterase [Streptomyces sp. NPDC006552]|uniref:PaaI family thioesterase n=1 Tax=Streptomyces sp. NPDC006552 TaxID=3157179 RepID=UPI0033B74552